MFGRPARVLCLAVAAWALLFAPGAASTSTSTTQPAADRVAAAVLAPTLEADSVTLARKDCRCDAREHQDVDPLSLGIPPVAAIGMSLSPVRGEAWPVELPRQGRRNGSVALRGPPSV